MSPSLTSEPLAHLTETCTPHLLIDHLLAVGARAAEKSARFDAAAWAELAGRWHDLGKYAQDFQDRIRAANGFAAHIDSEANNTVRDHSSAGAIYAKQTLGMPLGMPLAFVIAGHHAGLDDLTALSERLVRRADRLQDALAMGIPKDVLQSTPPAFPAWLQGNTPEHKRRMEMWIRFLFSALCDADFLDTEAFYNPARAALRGSSATPALLKVRLDAHLEALRAEVKDTAVNRVRAEILTACRTAAPLTPGLFSLTAPTGGGKTLAAMAFALAHAECHGLERVVVAIPYTAIIEQNAAIYGDVLGRECVIEHHSALDPARATPQNRVACENWDAPVVVTTTVQLFESLLGRRTSVCRKLHHLARSVIVLDEAQTLPPGLLAPLLDTLRILVEHFGCTVVFATATQPAFGAAQLKPGVGLANIREIVAPSRGTFERLRRVRVHWPQTPAPLPYPALAEQVAQHPDVLVIVHRRSDARELVARLDAQLGQEQTIHLSALMCPAHRTEVLGALQTRRRAGEPVRVVATQLVETGVDLDFPVVYRALGGLDALAQAAGRCNREGRLDQGDLHVFLAPTEPPKGVLQTALGITQTMLAQDPSLDLFAPATHQHYFRMLYGARDLDEKRLQKEREKFAYRTVADQAKLIEDDWSAPLIVRYGQASEHLDALTSLGPSRDRLRALQRFTITVPRRLLEEWRGTGQVETVAETVEVLADSAKSAYDLRFGLVPERVSASRTALLLVDG